MRLWGHAAGASDAGVADRHAADGASSPNRGPAGEWLPYLAACVGANPPMRLPAWLARPLAGDVAVGLMTEGRGFSNAKAKRELGWERRYPTWRRGFTEGLN